MGISVNKTALCENMSTNKIKKKSHSSVLKYNNFLEFKFCLGYNNLESRSFI